MDERSLKIKRTDFFSARNYSPLPVVMEKGKGVWIYDVNGKAYVDCLSCYSALNFGHNHPRLVQAVLSRLMNDGVSVTSRAVYTDNLDEFCESLAKFCRMDKVLPMNTGAEAVETAIKIARKWGYKVKKVKKNKANIVVCHNNFHGRTTTIVGFSSTEQYKKFFGPYAPDGTFRSVLFGDFNSLKQAIDKNTAAVLIEPIQGEAGVIIPPRGYLSGVRKICTESNVLMIVDEVQTGFGRTGHDLAHFFDGIVPDMVLLGKALGGGILPVSAVVGLTPVMDVLVPGDHGSTFGGNPLACAVAIESMRLLQDEGLSQRSSMLGKYFLEELEKSLKGSLVRKVRGRGLMVGIELYDHEKIEQAALDLLERGVLVGRSHNVLRLNPPLIIEENALNFVIEKLVSVLN